MRATFNVLLHLIGQVMQIDKDPLYISFAKEIKPMTE